MHLERGEPVLSKGITRVGLAEGKASGMSAGEKKPPSGSGGGRESGGRPVERMCKGLGMLGGGQLQEALQSQAEKHLEDGLRDTDHLPAKSWSDSMFFGGEKKNTKFGVGDWGEGTPSEDTFTKILTWDRSRVSVILKQRPGPTGI